MRAVRARLTVGAAGLAAAALTAAPAAGVAAGSTGLPVAVAQPMVRTVAGADWTQPPTTAQCQQSYHIACYQPFQIQRAYHMPSLYQQGLTGAGRTIVLVDSFGSPTIRQDLAHFDKTFGLPAPPSLQIIQPAGRVPAYNPKDATMVAWAQETTLDVEWSHTMAPGANLLLVETPVAETEGTVGFPQIVQAENYVINHNMGDVISQSFGATEQTFPTAQSLLRLRSAYQNAYRHQVTVLASSGDTGPTNYTFTGSLFTYRVNSWPSSDPLVTSVGGTQLHLNAQGYRTAPDNVWNDQALFHAPAASGGGVSKIFSRPWYQNGVAGIVYQHRGTPDVSLSAAVNGGVVVYTTFGGFPAGWHIFGGTSEASPLLAGMVAIADQAAGHRLGLLNPQLYALARQGAPGIVDITRGTNTVSFTQNGQNYTVAGFPAVPGYDMSSGLGTINGARLVMELAH